MNGFPYRPCWRFIPVCRSFLLVILASQCFVSPAEAQATFLYREPTVCPTPFTPISGLTFHATHAWRIVWTTQPGQFGIATYTGPVFVTSEDGTAVWTNPALTASCWIEWYDYVTRREAIFRWHVEAYFGEVTENCDGAHTDLDPYSTEYDPYAFETDSGSCSGGGTGSGSGDPGDGLTDPTDPTDPVFVSPKPGEPGSEVCGGSTDLYYDYMCIEEWSEETQGWVELWCGVVAVCETYGSA